MGGEMVKRIKGTPRGLSFSFSGEENFAPGCKYHYVIDIKSKKIFLVSGQGKTIVCKKKIGRKIKSLFDLRNKQVKSVTGKADFLNIVFKKKVIVVEGLSYNEGSLVSSSECEKIIKRKKLKQLFHVELDYSVLKLVSGDFTISTDVSTGFIDEDIGNVAKVISLFSGAGMLDYAFKNDDRFQIVFANELDKDAAKSYRANIGDHLVEGSIVDIKETPKADVLVGGPVCKPFSNQNRTKRLKDHPDSMLMYEYIRIAKMGDFKAFVIENVPQILTACDGEYLNAIKELLSDFNIKEMVLKDCDFGGFSTRKRAFIIGSKVGEVEIPEPTYENYRTVREALSLVDSSWSGYHDVTVPGDLAAERMIWVPQGGNFLDIPYSLRTKGVHSNHYRRLHLDRPSCTLVNYRKPPIIHPTENRTLTIAEAAAISGLDKSFQFLGTLSAKQQQVGNGVPYALAHTVKEIVAKALKL